MAPPAGFIARAIARSFISGVMPEPEQVVKFILLAIMLPLALIALIFAGPIVIFKHVPVAMPGIVQMYMEAAKEVTASTKSPCDDGVELINWQQMIAIDAVRLKQDFKNVTKSRTESLAESFIEQVGT